VSSGEGNKLHEGSVGRESPAMNLPPLQPSSLELSFGSCRRERGEHRDTRAVHLLVVVLVCVELSPLNQIAAQELSSALLVLLGEELNVVSGVERVSLPAMEGVLEMKRAEAREEEDQLVEFVPMMSPSSKS
jgi:hypothetical protein